MRVHHLNCGTLCPLGGRAFGGTGGLLTPAPMCCHCLLIEGEDGLVLVDTGLGTGDVTAPGRLGGLFNSVVRPRLASNETAIAQLAALGLKLADLRHIVPTHLDLDHAGGLGDFPSAAVHVFAAELRAARDPTWRERPRYRKLQLDAVAHWAPIEPDGETWLGFQAVRALPGGRDDVLLIPLVGHSRGHCGVAVRTAEGWLLHCGDAYFHHSEVAPEGGVTPWGLRLFQSLVNIDGNARRANQARLKALARERGGEVRLLCSHDPGELGCL